MCFTGRSNCAFETLFFKIFTLKVWDNYIHRNLCPVSKYVSQLCVDLRTSGQKVYIFRRRCCLLPSQFECTRPGIDVTTKGQTDRRAYSTYAPDWCVYLWLALDAASVTKDLHCMAAVALRARYSQIMLHQPDGLTGSPTFLLPCQMPEHLCRSHAGPGTLWDDFQICRLLCILTAVRSYL